MVRGLLDEPAAVVEAGWSCRPLGGGASEGIGLYRVTGSARVRDATHPWALVCKVCAPADGTDPGAWDYPRASRSRMARACWRRCPGACRPALPGRRGAAGRDDPALARGGRRRAPRSVALDRYALVARHLGRFNGAYLAGAPLPDQPWLSRGWLRDFVEPSGPALAELERLAGPGGPPLLRRLYPPPVVAEITRLWTERERFLAALDRLPRTFCHHDAFRRNLLHRAGPEGEDLVAVDWAYAGHGAVGEELGQLVVASLYFFEAEGIEPRDLAAACFAGYVAGLREAGWAGDERLVRLGFAVDAALRTHLGLLRVIVPLVADPARRPVVEDRFGRPLDDVVEAWAELWPFQFGLAEEARALLPAIG